MKNSTDSIYSNPPANKNIHVYHEHNINVIIEMPVPDKERDMESIADIKKIMEDELLFQLRNGKYKK